MQTILAVTRSKPSPQFDTGVEMIRKLGYRVAIEDGLWKAFRTLRKRKTVRLVVIDFTVFAHGEDCRTFITAAKRFRPGARIIVYGFSEYIDGYFLPAVDGRGHTQDEVRAILQGIGFDEIIGVPIAVEKLEEIVRWFLQPSR